MNQPDAELDGLMIDLMKSLAPVAPPPALRDRVLQATQPSPLLTIRAANTGWRELGPGVAMRLLYQDHSGCSFLLRLAAGASFPAHDHAGTEECILLEGDLSLGDVTIHAGDYHLAPKGVRHGVLRSQHGALAFIRAARPIEYTA